MTFTSSDYPLLYQVNTRVWLKQIGAELGRPATLDDIPDAELDKLASRKFEWIYFLGVWQTGEVGRDLSRTNPEWLAEYRNTLADLDVEDICGSPFAVSGYIAHSDLGDNSALLRLRQRLNQRSMRLMLDFVPNHTAPDHLWVYDHPEYYIPGSQELLIEQPENYAQVQTILGKKILARGRDPYFPGWHDTLQLNYTNPDFQQAMQAELITIANLCDGLRCDMAMLILPEIFERTWGLQAPSFWPKAITQVRQQNPQFTFLAEVYWDLEAQLLEQGFDYAYDKRLYDTLVNGAVSQMIDLLRSTFQNQQRVARFLENHDEARAAAVFETGRHQAAAVITFLSPCLRFFHQGQLDGYRKKISVHLCRGPIEPGDPVITNFYSRLLECLAMDIFHRGAWQLLTPKPAWENSTSHQGMLAYSWTGKMDEKFVVIVNYAPLPGQCYLMLPLHRLEGERVLLKDRLGNSVYERQGDGLLSSGLYLDMPAWGFHLFELSII